MLKLKSLPVGHQKFLKLWAGSLVVVYAVFACFAILTVQREKRRAHANHALRMSADHVEPGQTMPDPLPETGDFIPVSIGLYMDNVDGLSIKDGFWSATFYVWFRWTGDPSLDPVNKFQILEASIGKREVLDQYTGADGVNYQRARVSARMIKYFNTTRVPLEDHVLTIRIEDGARDGRTLRYVADPDSNVSSRMKVPGFDIESKSVVVKNHTYRSGYGDPRIVPGERKTFTEFVFGIAIKRTSMGLYFKLLIGLFAGILLTLASLYVRPGEGPRVALPVGAYFGAVGNSYLVNSQLPSTGEFGMMDYITGLGLLTITACLIASLVSGHLYNVKKEETLAKALDQTTRRVVVVLYIIANIAVPLSAF